MAFRKMSKASRNHLLEYLGDQHFPENQLDGTICKYSVGKNIGRKWFKHLYRQP